MRTILPLIFLIATSCSDRGTKGQVAHIDTLQLPDPKPKSPSAEEVQMFENCLVLFYPNYVVISSNMEYSFGHLDSLKSFLIANANTIGKNKFYLISDSNTKFSKIVSAIDILLTTKINNYEVINYQEFFGPPTTVTEQPPTSNALPNIENDSTYLIITILPNILEVKLFNQVTELKNATELNKFIINHKAGINSNKVLIVSSSDLPYSRFEPVYEVLKKHKYYEYNLMSKELPLRSTTGK
jgi:biopolymer transport protein ExbD